MEIPLQETSMHGWLRSQDNGDATTRDKHAWWVKRLQFQRLGKRIENSTTASARLGNSEERTIVAFACSCCGKPPRVLVEQFVWRLKKRFRWSWKSCSNNIQSSYDLRSYHLNFDKGWSRQR
ncbi:hypothetical protein Bca101_050660 [Brassica carinata]